MVIYHPFSLSFIFTKHPSPGMYSQFAEQRHLRSLPCVFLRLSHGSPFYVGATEQNVSSVISMRFWNRRFIIGIDQRTVGFIALFPLKFDDLIQSGYKRANGSVLTSMPLVYTGSFARLVFASILLTFADMPFGSCIQTLQKLFRRRLHPNLHRQLRPEALDDIQARYSLLHKLGSNTGASFQSMRGLLSAAFPSTQLYYFLRLVELVKEPFRSKAHTGTAQAAPSFADHAYTATSSSSPCSSMETSTWVLASTLGISAFRVTETRSV